MQEPVELCAQKLTLTQTDRYLFKEREEKTRKQVGIVSECLTSDLIYTKIPTLSLSTANLKHSPHHFKHTGKVTMVFLKHSRKIGRCVLSSSSGRYIEQDQFFHRTQTAAMTKTRPTILRLFPQQRQSKYSDYNYTAVKYTITYALLLDQTKS